MQGRVRVVVLADEPDRRAEWVAALAAEPGMAVVGAGPATAGAVSPTDDAVVIVVASERGRGGNAEGEGVALFDGDVPVVVLLAVESDALDLDVEAFEEAVERERAPGERFPTGEVLRRGGGRSGAEGGATVVRIHGSSSPGRVAAVATALWHELLVWDPLVGERSGTYADEGGWRTRDPDALGLDGALPEDDVVRPEPLTEREHEVLGALASGATNKVIAVDLGISDNTVKFHVASLLTKFGVSTRTELVVRALQTGALRL